MTTLRNNVSCDCNEPKPCCGCLKGGDDGICEKVGEDGKSCACHSEPGADFEKRYSCPVCIEAERLSDIRYEAYDKLARKKAELELPSRAEIERTFSGRGILE